MVLAVVAGFWPAVIVACTASSTYPPPLGDCEGGVCVAPKMDATVKNDVAVPDTGTSDASKADAPADAPADVTDAAISDSSVGDASDASDASDAALD